MGVANLEAGRQTHDADSADSRKRRPKQETWRQASSYHKTLERLRNERPQVLLKVGGQVELRTGCKSDHEQLDPQSPLPVRTRYLPPILPPTPLVMLNQRESNSEAPGTSASPLEKGIKRKFTHCMVRPFPVPFPQLALRGLRLISLRQEFGGSPSLKTDCPGDKSYKPVDKLHTYRADQHLFVLGFLLPLKYERTARCLNL